MSSLRPLAVLIALSSLPGLSGCGDGASSFDASAGPDVAVVPDDALAPDLGIRADGGVGDLAGATDAAVDPAVLLAQRPYTLTVPTSYNAAVPMPLVLMIHGYNSDSVAHEAWFQLAPLAETAGFLYARADGTRDFLFKRGWNATDACCFFQPSKPDDLSYLKAVLDDVTTKYKVDPKRVFVIGHSNGGFMTNRLACELSARIAAVVSFAGAVWKDPTACPAAVPVAYLQIHADNDPTVAYAGGKMFVLAPAYPSAHETVATWATKDGCAGALAPTGATVDLVSSVAGAETTVEAYSGCQAGSAVELWTMSGIALADSPHQPPMTAAFAQRLWGFLSAHPRP